MPNLTHNPDFHIRPITAYEWQANATGNLALPPGFWEPGGPGTPVREGRVKPLGAFLKERMIGYVGVREVSRGQLSPETNAALHGLMERRRMSGDIGNTALGALEDPTVPDSKIVAYNLAFALVAERGQGVGLRLTLAAIFQAAKNATPEQPIPAYASVAEANPSARLLTRLGFEPLSVDGKPYTKMHDYYQPPAADGTFAPPVNVPHLMMGTVLEGNL
ncbi:MAG TPA: hypothetical protein VLF62_00190 [Candidatus Saccharimonadales bacterium]|nr:hypothetical protein [Candidatus Saccharimonadales bacterium]